MHFPWQRLPQTLRALSGILIGSDFGHCTFCTLCPMLGNLSFCAHEICHKSYSLEQRLVFHCYLDSCFPPRLVGVDFPPVSPTKSCLPLLSGLLLSSLSCGCRLPPVSPTDLWRLEVTVLNKVLSSTLVWTTYPSLPYRPMTTWCHFINVCTCHFLCLFAGKFMCLTNVYGFLSI